MPSPLYIAVDLGASSGRVFLVGLDSGGSLIEEVRRFEYPPREQDGHLRWDFGRIFQNITLGLRAAVDRARTHGRTIHSLGVDSWAVDYGLLDVDGRLISDPVCYRDPRTRDTMQQVFAIVPLAEIFERTGIQFLNFNTLFQLVSEGKDLVKTSRLLLLPDLVNFFLTGHAAAEYTNATTTQMVNAATGDWDLELIEQLGIPARLLSRIVPSGTDLGQLKSGLAEEIGLEGVRVIAPATHDTASAVAAAPLGKDWAYISSGTWSLIGIERSTPLINKAVESHNFTNEGGAYGSIRFLKNVMGLWIFEFCRREWREKGVDLTYDYILRRVGEIGEFQAFIFPDDERFLNPPSMIDAIRQQVVGSGQRFEDDPAAISKMIFDSLAFRYASVLRTIEDLTKTKLAGLQILGGGGRNKYLDQATANASGLVTRVGLTEAAVVGNVIVQAISSGRFSSLAEARAFVSENFGFQQFEPCDSADLDDARRRYAEIESRFVN